MNDKIYEKPQPPTSEQQQIKMRLARLGDELVRLDKEKVDILMDISTLQERLIELNNKSN